MWLTRTFGRHYIRSFSAGCSQGQTFIINHLHRTIGFRLVDCRKTRWIGDRTFWIFVFLIRTRSKMGRSGRKKIIRNTTRQSPLGRPNCNDHRPDDATRRSNFLGHINSWRLHIGWISVSSVKNLVNPWKEN